MYGYTRGHTSGPTNDGWQFALPFDLTVRMGIIVSLLIHHWPHSAVVISICLLAPYLIFLACRLMKSLEFLWDDPRKLLSNDEVILRRSRVYQI